MANPYPLHSPVFWSMIAFDELMGPYLHTAFSKWRDRALELHTYTLHNSKNDSSVSVADKPRT